MLVTAIRTVIIYIGLIVAMRVMGKRQLGDLQPIELVITLIISDLAAVPMQETGIPLLSGLIPILLLVALEILLSAGMLKSSAFSRLVTGTPLVVISHGKIQQKALKRMRMTVEDLMENLRGQNVFDLSDVETAIAETNGKISVYLTPASQPATCGDMNVSKKDRGIPLVILSDGKPCDWAMELCGWDQEKLDQVIAKSGYARGQIFLITANKQGQYTIVLKEETA